MDGIGKYCINSLTQSKKDRYQMWFHMWIPDSKYSIFNTYFHFYLFICVCTSVWVCISAGTHISESWSLDNYELPQELVTELRSSQRAETLLAMSHLFSSLQGLIFVFILE